LKKTLLFTTEIDFLGHHISANGIKVDKAKVARILDWPCPTKTMEVRAFLGIVRYPSDHLPTLAMYTHQLMPLTTKAAELNFPASVKPQIYFPSLCHFSCLGAGAKA
jgi:hypothetical protein